MSLKIATMTSSDALISLRRQRAVAVVQVALTGSSLSSASWRWSSHDRLRRVADRRPSIQHVADDFGEHVVRVRFLEKTCAGLRQNFGADLIGGIAAGENDF